MAKCKYYDQLSFLFEKTVNSRESNIDVQHIASATQETQDMGTTKAIDQPKKLATPSTSTVPSKRKIPLASESTIPPGKVIQSAQASNAKRKGDPSLVVDTMLVKTLHDIEKREQREETAEKGEDANGDLLFCKSLFPILQGLPAKKNRFAKMKIQQLLFEVEFGEGL